MGTVIMMENANFHKRPNMLEAISANQCLAEFLPAYSPDLNRLNTNGLQLKPLAGNTDVVWISSFLSIHSISFYNDLAIPL